MRARLTEIEQNQVLHYLGYPGGEIPAELLAQIEACREALFRAASPKAVWRIFPLSENGLPQGTDFVPEGEDIRALLLPCRKMILMAATLGADVEALFRRVQVRNMAEAVILDACGSAAIENVCDNLCADLEAELSPLFLTDRFSPGYGDMPLRQQAELFRVLDVSRRIGVGLSESGLMVPQKSVTAVLGAADMPQPKRSRGCAACRMFGHCTYRKEGKHCEAA